MSYICYVLQVLMDMFFQDDDVALGVEEEFVSVRRGSLKYEEIVKDMILEETQYIRDLDMITKVFKRPFVRLFHGRKVNVLFCIGYSDIISILLLLYRTIDSIFTRYFMKRN